MGINQRGVDVAHYRRIRELREDHDLTQRQLANYLNMPQPQYFRYEQGYRDIPTDILIALADLYRSGRISFAKIKEDMVCRSLVE